MTSYSLKEVAKEVGRCTSTITRWIDLKKVDVTKKKNARGHLVFTESDLKKLIEHNEKIDLVG
jgi:uncharacterized protein YajQ (UPF0234 family)